MNQTMEVEINKEFENYIVIYKTMSDDRTKGFYRVYGKNAIVFAYLLKLKIRYKYINVAKVKRKMLSSNKKEDNKKEKVFTSYVSVPLQKFNEIVSVLNYNHANYMIIDKAANYNVMVRKEFKANKYDYYYNKGLHYIRILPKINTIESFLERNSDNGEIMYLIYDIERSINDFKKRNENRDTKDNNKKDFK